MRSSAQKILYVDSDKDNCELMGFMLYQANPNYAVTALTDPENALELTENLSFDLYILENWFPATTGAELCRRIRERDPRKPVLFFSSLARDSERTEALAAGANEYLVKPRDLTSITAKVEYYLTLEDQSIAALERY